MGVPGYFKSNTWETKRRRIHTKLNASRQNLTFLLAQNQPLPIPSRVPADRGWSFEAAKAVRNCYDSTLLNPPPALGASRHCRLQAQPINIASNEVEKARENLDVQKFLCLRNQLDACLPQHGKSCGAIAPSEQMRLEIFAIMYHLNRQQKYQTGKTKHRTLVVHRDTRMSAKNAWKLRAKPAGIMVSR